MPRLGVNVLRWLLLAANLAALGGLGYLAFGLFVPAEDDQLRISLPDPASVFVSTEVRQTFDAKDLNQILRIHKDMPRAKPEAKPVEVAQPPLAEGGPLSGWEVATTIVYGGRKLASIQEKVQQAVITPGSRTTVGAPDPRSGRGRATTSRPRATPQRRANPQTAQRMKGVFEGSTFRIDGNHYQALRVTIDPCELEYRDVASGRPYKLTGAVNPWLGYEPGSAGGILLRGLEAAELGIDPTQNPLQAAQEAAAQDDRGEVKKANEPAAAAPAARPGATPTANDARAKEDAAENQKAQLQELQKNMPEADKKAVQEALQGAGGKPQR